jgi:hypothetical protein
MVELRCNGGAASDIWICRTFRLILWGTHESLVAEKTGGVSSERKRLRWRVECVWNLMAHDDARVRKWRGNWREECVARTLTLPRNVVYPALLPLMLTPQLPAGDRTDAPADLNGLVHFGERRNLVSARVPSRFKRTILPDTGPPSFGIRNGERTR